MCIYATNGKLESSKRTAELKTRNTLLVMTFTVSVVLLERRQITSTKQEIKNASFFLQIVCLATASNGYTPEKPLVHIIRIEDDNDNPPIFSPEVCNFFVDENSLPGKIS